MANDERASPESSGRGSAEYAAAQWIARRGAPGWTEADAAAFKVWLEESVDHRVAYYRFNAAWDEAGRLAAFRRSSQFAVVGINPSGLASRPRRGALFALAASALIALVGGFLWVYGGALFDPNYYHTAVGGLKAVPLPDGSRITLNTDSVLRVNLTESERKVELDHGEAFFEVAKDAHRPFVVNAGTKRIIAVGTAFSVLHEGRSVSVKVTEGTVRIEDRAPDGGVVQAPEPSAARVVLLSAGAVAQVDNDSVLVHDAGKSEVELSLSWRSGVLTFRDRTLAEVVAEFNRYNKRQIVIADPSIANIQLGGVFRSTNVDRFIGLLEQGFPIRVKAGDDQIILTRN